MFRAIQMCCLFLIGTNYILAASRSDGPPPPAAHSDSYAPRPPEWATAFPNG